MFLILEVVSANKGNLGPASHAIFTTAGGSIGRRAGNDWILADQHVSGRHARVRAIGGTFFLEDNDSANGVLVNGNRLHAGEPFPLKDGDQIFIDPFEIVVRVSMTRPGSATEVMSNQAAPPAPGRADPQASPPVHPGGGSSRAVGGLDDIIGEAAGAIPSDFNPLLEPQPQAPVRPTAADLQGRPIIHDAIEIAVPAQRPARRPTPAPPGAIPTNWDADDTGEPYVETASGLQPTAPPPARPAPGPIETPPARAAPRGSGGAAEHSADFAALLRGAGMPPEAMSAEVMQEFGQALRIVIEGLMEVLRARGEIRNEFRLPQTTFKPRDNNPLKLAVNAEDAIHNLLVKRNPAYLGTTAAFDDAFKDVRHHQLALLAGMRAAYEFMLQRFNPQALKTQFDSKPGRKGGLGFGGQGRYWDAFEEYYRDVTADPSDCFRRLFGDQFARAYEEQIQRLRSTRQSKG